MTFLVERLVELKRHLDHLAQLAPRVRSAQDLDADMSLRNDVLFSLLSVAQLVIDVSGELSARRGLRFEDYMGAIANLRRFEEFGPEHVEELKRLPGFRNVLIHEYVAFDLDRAVSALHRLEPIREFLLIVSRLVENLES